MTPELQQFLVDGLPFLVINVISFVVVGVILLKINWALTLFVLVPVPMLILAQAGSGASFVLCFFVRTMVGHLHSVLGESLQGLRVIKACSRERHRIKIFDSVNNRLASTQVTTQRVSGSFNETIVLDNVTWGDICLVLCLENDNRGKMVIYTLGAFWRLWVYIWLFYGPLQWFSVILHWMTHAFSGAERIFEVLDTSPERYESIILLHCLNKRAHRIS
jgi:ATP-binding cassette subfamily B protein